MRAKEFIVEYSQAKTAEVFGRKLLAALSADSSSFYPNGLGTAHAYLRQKDKIGAEYTDQNSQQILKDILASLEGADPTPHKQYTQWLAKCYANEHQKIEDLVSKGADWLKTYHLLKVHRILPPNLTDINRITFSSLYDVKERYAQQLLDKMDAADQAAMSKGKSRVLLDNDKVRIIVPEDIDAARYYGQGTQWCTAAKNNNMFDRYRADGDLYIFLPKHPEYDGEKYQLQFASGQCMDETDEVVANIYKFLTQKFGNLVQLFKHIDPKINDWIVFADDARLKDIISNVRDLAMDFVSDWLSDLEQGDDYYYDWMKEQGFVDKNGDPDFYAPGASYIEYNSEARAEYNSITDILNMSPAELKANVVKYNQEFNAATIDEVVNAIAATLRASGFGRGVRHKIADRIEQQIFISPDGHVSLERGQW